MFQSSRLTDDQRLEYQELGEFARHDDTVHLNVSFITLPVLLGALALALQQPGLRFPLAVGSLVVWTYWWVVRARRTDWARRRYERLRELEAKGNLWHHRMIHEADKRRGFFQRVWQIKRIEVLASVVLFVFWMGVVATPLLAVVALFAADYILAFVFAELKVSKNARQAGADLSD